MALMRVGLAIWGTGSSNSADQLKFDDCSVDTTGHLEECKTAKVAHRAM